MGTGYLLVAIAANVVGYKSVLRYNPIPETVREGVSEELLYSFCDRAPIVKNTTSNERRFVAVLGYEHAGHHLWSAAFNEVGRGDGMDAGDLTTLATDLYASQTKDGRLPCGNATAHTKLCSKILQAFPYPQPRSKRDPNTTRPYPTLIPFLLTSSYPTSRRIWNPDFTLLAMGAEAAGVDMRFAVLVRPVNEVLGDTQEQKLSCDRSCAYFHACMTG